MGFGLLNLQEVLERANNRTHLFAQIETTEAVANVDEILAVWYPTHAAFLDLHSMDGADDLWRRRQRCVANAVLHRCPGDRNPLQP